MKQFEINNITTSYDEWYNNVVEKFSDISNKFNDVNVSQHCLDFANKQSAFMTGPVANFNGISFEAITRRHDTLDIDIDGPLYMVYEMKVDDTSKEKTVEKDYLDPETFETKFGWWYPQKTVYNIRYGKKSD